jgi:hypothetical protein
MLAGILMALSVAACGDDGGSVDSNDTTASGGGSSTTETSSDGIKPADCDDAFATLEGPYMVDNVTHDTFVADENGLVVAPMVDPGRFDNVLDFIDYPDVEQLVTIDLEGNVTTIYSGEHASFWTLAVDATTVYARTLLLNSDIISVPRSGGDATVLVDNGASAGPVLHEGRLYYGGESDEVDHGVFELDPSGGVPTLLSDRTDLTVNAITADEEYLYWTEYDGPGGDVDYTVYKMGFADGSVEQMATLARDSGVDYLLAGGGDLYVTGIGDLSATSLSLRRIVPGAEPAVVADIGPVAFSEDSAYYGDSSEIVKTPFDFSVSEKISGIWSYVTALTVGPQHLWYADRGCIYRTSK